jgi:hypothetical protein
MNVSSALTYLTGVFFFNSEFANLFAAEHDVGGPLQAVDDGLAAGVQVVVLVLHHLKMETKIKLSFFPSLPSWLSDGIFSNQKLLFGYSFECLRMGKVGIFYGH